MTRRSRFLTAIVAGAALLFSQLAVSVHACPMAQPAHAMAQPGCHEAAINANLCRSHCDYGSVSVDPAKPVHASAVAIESCLRVTLPGLSAAAIIAPSAHIAAGPAPPSPVRRFTVLRI